MSDRRDESRSEMHRKNVEAMSNIPNPPPYRQIDASAASAHRPGARIDLYEGWERNASLELLKVRLAGHPEMRGNQLKSLVLECRAMAILLTAPINPETGEF